MIGVVLCGGKSSRMGADKGTLRMGCITWAEIAYGKLRSMGCNNVLSVNESQYEHYATMFPGKRLIRDQVNMQGPLCGILSVHLEIPHSDLLVLACDMPDITPGILDTLYYQYCHSGENYDFWVYRNEQSFEPLCGIYSAAGLQKIWRQYSAGTLGHAGIRKVLAAQSTLAIMVGKHEERFFRNYNEPWQLQAKDLKA